MFLSLALVSLKIEFPLIGIQRWGEFWLLLKGQNVSISVPLVLIRVCYLASPFTQNTGFHKFVFPHEFTGANTTQTSIILLLLTVVTFIFLYIISIVVCWLESLLNILY